MNTRASVNYVHLVGELAVNPVMTATSRGVRVANLTLTTLSHKSKDHEGKKTTKRTNHTVVCYGDNVRRVEDLKPGDWLQVIGYLDAHTGPDKLQHQEIRVQTVNVFGSISPVPVVGGNFHEV